MAHLRYKIDLEPTFYQCKIQAIQSTNFVDNKQSRIFVLPFANELKHFYEKMDAHFMYNCYNAFCSCTG
jgi:hypothetical protein